ncbi:MAG: methyltransferase [Buchnera aphidicola (Nurudea shiraii)]
MLISGNISNLLHLNKLSNVIICTQNFENWNYFKKTIQHKVKFILLEEKKIICNSDVILYFWPNSKYEAIFHLQYIFSKLSKKSLIFLVGRKNSGINTAKNLLKTWITLEKIDSAKHCLLFCGKVTFKPKFHFNSFIYTTIFNDIQIKTIPGIFGYKKIDIGSQLLISTFKKSIQGDVLDIGCGSGILSVLLYKISQKVKLTLIDINIAALESSKLTLKHNNVPGEVFPSNVYSNIFKKFNFIISNPSIHKNSKINLNFIKEIIEKSEKYLKAGGEIRVVVSSNILCHKYFQNTCLKYKILKETKNFRVYQGKNKKKIK